MFVRCMCGDELKLNNSNLINSTVVLKDNDCINLIRFAEDHVQDHIRGGVEYVYQTIFYVGDAL